MPSSPASPGNTTNSASPEKIDSSALTTSTWMVAFAILLERLRFFLRLFDGAYHVERLLGQRAALAVDDHLEALDGVLQRHVLSRRAGKVLRHREGLRQETLNFACARHGKLVFGRELVHAEDRDDVAQLLVALQRRLHRARGVVVVLPDRVRVDLARG